MSKPWSGVGAWALEAEQAEAEELAAATAAVSSQSQSFPPLKDAAAAAAKPKKKKPVPIPLSHFAATTDADLLLRLPTRPRDRPPDSDHHLEFSALRRPVSGSGGGGFRDEPQRGRPQPRAQEMSLPSRADEVDNWAAAKRPLAPPPSEVNRGGCSRADDVDNWTAGKKPVERFGSGFRNSIGSDSDRWVRRGGGGLSSSNGERRRLVLDPPKKDGGNVRSEVSRGSLFGAARPREEVLAEKGVDWRKIELDIDSKKVMSRPTSSYSQSSRAESPGVEVGARTRVNPFGDAKPREVLLEAKGKDWRKIDLELEHRGINRFEIFNLTICI